MNARRDAWLIGAYYFFFYGAAGCLIPYLPLHYRNIGLSGEQIGLLMAIGPVVLLLSGVSWGALGDRFNLHRWLLPIASAGVILPAFLLSRAQSLTPLILGTLLLAFFANAIGPLMDSAALEIAGRAGLSFGRLRLGGSIGFTLFSVVMGWLLTRVPLTWLFFGYGAGMAVATFIALLLPARRSRWQQSTSRGLRALFDRPALALFLAAAFLLGIAINGVQFFFPLYMTALGGDANLLGLAGAVAALSEIPVMYNASRILKRIGGLWAGVRIGLVLYVVRWLAFAFAADPLTAIALQVLHGPSFGLFIISGVGYVESQAPEGLSATAQSLFIAALWGVGASVGSFGGGIIFEQVGGAALFQAAALVTLLSLISLLASRYAVGGTQ